MSSGKSAMSSGMFTEDEVGRKLTNNGECS